MTRSATQRESVAGQAGRTNGGAVAAIRRTTRAGALLYDRARHLPRLIRALPDEFERQDVATTLTLIARLDMALAAERRRGRAGHWTYDMNRHIALLQAIEAERTHLNKMKTRPLQTARPPM